MAKARSCNPVAKASLALSVSTMSLGVTLIRTSCVNLAWGLQLGIKRPYHDYWDTPSDMDKRAREFKMIEKIRSIDFGKLTVDIRHAIFKSNIFM
jgi:hypothetical protein